MADPTSGGFRAYDNIDQEPANGFTQSAASGRACTLFITANGHVGPILIVERRFSRMRFALVLTILALAACLVAWVVLLGPTADPTPVDVMPAEESVSGVAAVESGTQGFLGATACRDCHAEMFEGFAQTAHHRTSLLPSAETILGTFPAVLRTANPDLHFELQQTEKGFFQSAVGFRNGRSDRQRQRIDLILGSGKLGQSFLYWRKNVFGEDELFQLPVSYVTPSDKWENSPGYNDGQADFDRVIQPRCLECHTTWVGSSAPPRPGVNSYDRERFVLGISCEKCHGPGQQHVTHHREHPQDDSPRYVTQPGSLPPQRQIELCSLCHSGAGIPLQPTFSYRPGDPLDEFLELPPHAEQNRIGVHSNNQVSRLSKSRCFQETKGMTCTTCHDLHRFERGDLTTFSQRCLQCHQLDLTGTHEILGAQVNDNCIDCHVLKHEDKETPFETPEGTFYVEMRDHLIGIYPAASAAYLKQHGLESETK